MKNGIVFACMIIISAIVMAGCRQETAGNDNEAMVQNIDVVEEIRGQTGEENARESAEENTEEILQQEAADYHDLEEALRPGIIQITCGNYEGSGIIWSIDDEFITVLSNKHVLQESDVCRITFFSGSYYAGTVIFTSDNYDIGLAEIPVKDIAAEQLPFLKEAFPETEIKTEIRSLRKGENLLIFGSVEEAADHFLMGYAEQTEVDTSTLEYGVIDGGKDVNMSDANMNIEGKQDGKTITSKKVMIGRADVRAGLSGSGVFDTDGNLVGIITGGDGEGSFMAVQIWDIVKELEDAGIHL